MSDGALCVFPPGFTDREGEPLPLIVRKQDGGYGYAATDLAAIRYRTQTLGGDAHPLRRRRAAAAAPRDGLRRREGRRLARAAGARRARRVRLDPRPRQEDVQDARGRHREARRRCSTRPSSAPRAVVAEKNPDLDDATRAAVARADRHRRDQVRRPLQRSHQGLRLRLGSHARVRGQHGAVPPVRARAHPLDLPQGRGRRRRRPRSRSHRRASRPSGRSRSSCSGSAGVVASVAETLQPHRLCTYLFELATRFTTFFDKCSVLKADDEATRAPASRSPT